ncbi:uncharacterized protein LOC119066027 [Bradysia coprophila]|uniref:uncharacterized protein LOC119066027 n=1 Tax=Bradysia coprophila TaxID=38358 RepID=UPI00187DDA0B|nr:uncharacterized protein LOC119066027 [Bradysia coprophila]
MLTKDQWFCDSCVAKMKAHVGVSSDTDKTKSTNNVVLPKPANLNVKNTETATGTSIANPVSTNIATTATPIPTAGTSIANPISTNVASTTIPTSIAGTNIANPISANIASSPTTLPGINVELLPTQIAYPNLDQSGASNPADAHIIKPGHKHSKTKSIKSTTSLSKMRNLAIQRLEEELKLTREREKDEIRLRRERDKEDRERREKQETEYLDKKYSLLALESRSLLDLESDDSLSYDGFDESFKPGQVDPGEWNVIREAEIEQWVRQAKIQNPVNGKAPITQTVLPPSNTTSDSLFVPPQQAGIQSTTKQSKVHSSTVQGISPNTSQQQNVVPTTHSNPGVNQLIPSSNQILAGQQTSQININHLPPTIDPPINPRSNMINSTLNVPASAAVTASGNINQANTTAAPTLNTSHPQHIPSNLQPPSIGQIPNQSIGQIPNQSYQQTMTHQLYHQPISSVTRSLFGYPNPIPNYQLHQQPPGSIPMSSFGYQNPISTL